jgi:hypothetical protein
MDLLTHRQHPALQPIWGRLSSRRNLLLSSRIRSLIAITAFALFASSCTAFTWGTTLGAHTPTADAGGDWTSVTVGGGHSCRIDSDKALWCEGDSTYGQVGHGSTVEAEDYVQIAAAKWRAVEASQASTCGIQLDRTLWCWGNNEVGQVGDGTTTDRLAPVQVGSDNTWRQVDGGFGHYCATRTDDSMWCWGWDIGFQPDGETIDAVTAPVQVGGNDWKQAIAADTHSCAIKTDSTLWCWGVDIAGVTGHGPSLDPVYPSPRQVGTSADWLVVEGEFDYTCGVKTDRSLWCWGAFNSSIPESEVPVQIGIETNWLTAAGGTNTACAIKTDLSLWCWGRNGDGQVGDGTTIDRPLPVLVGSGPFLAVDVAWTSQALALGPS